MHNLIDKLPRLTLKFPFDASCNNSCTNNKHGEDDMKATCRTLCLLWLVLAAGMGWAKEQGLEQLPDNVVSLSINPFFQALDA